MVTGRELPELKQVFHHLDRFDFVVAENGALLYCPHQNRTRLLCEAASPELVQRLQEREIQPLSVGQAVIATIEPNEIPIIEEIKSLGLELEVIFNKGSVMVLPTGVNKATGLAMVLKEMKLECHQVVGVGDAENDHAFLEICGVGVAVSNALPMLKERADLVTNSARGKGVEELIDLIVRTDLAEIKPRPREPQPIKSVR
jgi:HAD superfamily hydrolase (TIGR01484 family)